MSKRSIFIGASALLLTVAAVANAKFTSTAAYFKTAGATVCKTLRAASGSLFTNAGINRAKIVTNSGGTTTLFANSACTTPVYLKVNI